MAEITAPVSKRMSVLTAARHALVGERSRVLDENGNIVIGNRLRITARTRSEQHHALNAVAVDFRHRSTEADQHRVFLRSLSHSLTCITKPVLSHLHCTIISPSARAPCAARRGCRTAVTHPHRRQRSQGDLHPPFTAPADSDNQLREAFRHGGYSNCRRRRCINTLPTWNPGCASLRRSPPETKAPVGDIKSEQRDLRTELRAMRADVPAVNQRRERDFRITIGAIISPS